MFFFLSSATRVKKGDKKRERERERKNTMERGSSCNLCFSIAKYKLAIVVKCVAVR